MTKVSRRTFIGLAAATGAAALASNSLAGKIGAAIGGDSMKIDNSIPKRKLGKTGEMLSILAFGGFHLIETLPSDAEKMINYYLDAGGNFIETAISYGDSERKIGRVMKSRRSDCFLSSKTHFRTKAEAADSINTSLKNLQTDHLDNLFMHNVATQADLDAMLAPSGALAAALEAKESGKVRYISVTGHNPEILYKALQAYPFDAVMEWMNYFDYFNFPLIYEKIIPYCTEKGIGMIAMKPVADGLLYRSPENAFRWAWSLPICSVAAGNNNMDILKKNIKLAKRFKPMSKADKETLYKDAPEYADYVCRRCEHCAAAPKGLDLKAIFELEGYYDRQMYTGNIPDAAEYALRERLRFWFANQDIARSRYSQLEAKVPADVNSLVPGGKCPYNIDIKRKLKIAAWKLTGDESFIGG